MLFASWLYKDDELRDGKKLFPFVFSFSKMMLSFSKRMVSFRKVHWVFFLSLELRSSFEKKNSMDFPSGHHPFASGQHHFASGENNCKKFFAIPQYPHPYIIFWQIKTPDFIFQLLSIISHPFGFILQQTPIQNYINFSPIWALLIFAARTIFDEKFTNLTNFWIWCNLFTSSYKNVVYKLENVHKQAMWTR